MAVLSVEKYWRATHAVRAMMSTLVTHLMSSSVAQSRPTLCNPMDYSTPRFAIHHQLPELTQTQFHWVGDAIQPSYHLSSTSPTFSLSQHPVFSNESVVCIRWPKYWRFSFSISPSKNIQGWFPLGLSGLISLQSKGLSKVFSNTPQFKSINSLPFVM